MYIFNIIQRINQQSEEVQGVPFKNLNYNAFALLPENVLYSMMKSNDLEVRGAALKKILYIRSGKPAKMRLKKITTFNIEATHLPELTNLSQSGICEPALTEHSSDQAIQDVMLNGRKLELPDQPSQSQSVERAMKLTSSEASQTFYGLYSRYKQILVKVLSFALLLWALTVKIMLLLMFST